MLSVAHRMVSCGVVAALIAGCGEVKSSEPQKGVIVEPKADVPPNTVIIDNFTFTPATLTVAAGTKVTWINKDDVPHTVTSDDTPRALDSRALDTDERYEFTFKTAGTYAYFCTVHSHMTATVIVK